MSVQYQDKFPQAYFQWLTFIVNLTGFRIACETQTRGKWYLLWPGALDQNQTSILSLLPRCGHNVTNCLTLLPSQQEPLCGLFCHSDEKSKTRSLLNFISINVTPSTLERLRNLFP